MNIRLIVHVLAYTLIHIYLIICHAVTFIAFDGWGLSAMNSCMINYRYPLHLPFIWLLICLCSWRIQQPTFSEKLGSSINTQKSFALSTLPRSDLINENSYKQSTGNKISLQHPVMTNIILELLKYHDVATQGIKYTIKFHIWHLVGTILNANTKI